MNRGFLLLLRKSILNTWIRAFLPKLKSTEIACQLYIALVLYFNHIHGLIKVISLNFCYDKQVTFLKGTLVKTH